LTLEEGDRMHIRQALAATNGRVQGPDGAAALLGINPSTLRSRIKKLGITTQRLVHGPRHRDGITMGRA
jgi:transcriptional regulator with GAF, ATPase, and Fis domain